MSSERAADLALEEIGKLALTQSTEAVRALHELCVRYSQDARLWFVLGSLLVQEGDVVAGERALRRAVELSPDHAVARFQLGLMQLTSGRAEEAEITWSELSHSQPSEALGLYVSGLRALVRDDFVTAREKLSEGLSHEQDPAMAKNMRLILEAMPPPAAPNDPETTTHWLLEYASRRTRH